ncbi:hypothetical protein N9Z22_00760, partial [bacterium]|nr:hypothetical protein [bacterium]
MPETLGQNLLNRKRILDALAGEVFGPGSHLALDDQGQRLPRPAKPSTLKKEFPSWEHYQNYCSELLCDKDSGEEILLGETPLQRYGTGVLFPSSTEEENEEILFQQATQGLTEDDEDAQKGDGTEDSNHKREEKDRSSGGDTPEHDVYLSTLRKPRSIGVSFVTRDLNIPLQAVVKGGFYVATQVIIKSNDGEKDAERTFWTRKSFERVIEIDLKAKAVRLVKEAENAPEVELSIHFRDHL